MMIQFSLFCEENFYSWDFTDCDIKEIIFAISLDTGKSIVVDDTVKGKSSLKFYGKDLEQGFDAFLQNSRLFVTKEDELWTVSRFRFEEKNEMNSLDVFSLSPHQILEKISEKTNKAITFDSLPMTEITIHLKDLTLEEILETLCMQINGYKVVKNKSGYHFAKVNNQNKVAGSTGQMKIELNEDGGIFVDARECSFLSITEALFEKFGVNRQFCFLNKVDSVIPRAVFVGRDFDETLEKLCIQNGFRINFREDIYYIVPDNNSKESLLNEEKEWIDITLEFSTASEVVPFLQKKFKNVEFLPCPDKSVLLCKVSESEKDEILNLVKTIDLERKVYSVDLKYIKTEDFLKIIPKSFETDNIQVMEGKSTICFKGTKKEYEDLLKQIEICDVPVKRINYDLLILQYDENSQNSWSSSFSAGRINQGDKNDISFQMGSVMGWNFNVVTAFGLEFAHSLQTSIEENRTKVFTDTTLHGVSGKRINFENTNTYRYRDNNIDPETGKPVYSGVTKEIVSGLKLDICGWVSGDGMITSSVTASVTRQGTDTSSSTGNPPPTTEKIVTTEVCCKSGEPIVLSGLIQNADVLEEKRSPGVSRIPLLGNLFKNKEKVSEKTQMVIYLVPHVNSYEKKTFEEITEDEEWIKKRIEDLLLLGMKEDYQDEY